MTRHDEYEPDATSVMTRPQEIAEKLARQIIRGHLPAGSRLPAERDLSVTYGTTRNVVREALKRLESVGLVRSRRGSGAYVQSLEFSASIELFDILMTHEDGSLNGPFLRDTLEFRGYIIRLIVRLAAVRRTEEEFQTVKALVAERAKYPNDPNESAKVTARLFHQIAYATHNQVFQLMFNTVEQASVRLRTLVDIPTLGFEQSQDVFVRIVDAFERKDAVMAELIVVRYIEAIEKALSIERSPEGLLQITS